MHFEMSRTLIFSHANGFPAGTYRRLFEIWSTAGWRVLAPDKLGHDPAFPVVSNWRPTRNELIGFIEQHRDGNPVHLVGHSLGGFLSLLTACRRPELVAGVVMLDSPVLAGWRAQALRVAKAARLIRRVSPSQVSHRRRTHWPSADALKNHFAGKQSFARWDPQVLDDYLHHGFETAPEGGLRLRFQREVESALYDTLPHHLGTLLRVHPPQCPVSFVAGTASEELNRVGTQATRRLVQERWRWIEGSHLFPMERPQDTAYAVLDLLGPMTATA